MTEEIKLGVNPKGNQPWMFIGRTDAEVAIFWPPDVNSQLTGKDLDVGKDWRPEEKGMQEDEMFGWYQWLNGHELGQTLGDGEGQGALVCCSPWGCKELDMTWWQHIYTSVQFSCSVVSDSLWPHESQHTRPPCPSPSPRVHSNSRLSLIRHASSGKQLNLSLPQFLYSLNGMVWHGMLSRVWLFTIPWTVAPQAPLSRWCHPAISSYVIPFSSWPQSLPASESFPMSQLFAWGGQSTGVSALASFLPKNTQGWSPCSPRDSHCSAIKRNEVLIHNTKCMNLKNTIPNGRSLTWKTPCMIPFTWGWWLSGKESAC